MKIKKKPLLAVVLLIMVAVIGFTIAYFTSSASFINEFVTGTYKVTTTEVFESPDNWTPGQEIPKTITTKNEGTIPAAVRVSYTEQWLDGDTDITDQIDEGTAIINLDNTSDWTKEGNYYYYNYILESNQTTSSFIRSVTLNPELGLDEDTDCTTSQDGLSITCEGTNPALGAKYILTLTKETVQYDKYKDLWDTDVEIAERVALAIGDTVNYSTSLNGVTLDDWKVFYIEGGYAYIIYGDYLSNSNVVFDNVEYDGYGYESDSRIHLLEVLSTKSNWEDLLTGTMNGTEQISFESDENIWAMGGPTLQLFVNSWNKTHPNELIYIKETDTMADGLKGYYIGKNENPDSYYVELSGGHDGVYVLPEASLKYGYMIATPGGEDNDDINIVTSEGDYGILCEYNYFNSGGYNHFRPVIKLPTSVLNQ